jgi:transcription-repair coupling factor (superfamily II helicase)
MRLVHYKRIASARSRGELDELQVEMIDRFGMLPAAIKSLFAVTWIKLLAQSLGIEKIQAGAKGGSIRFGQRATVDPVAMVGLVARNPQAYRLDGSFKLRFSWQIEVDTARIDALERLLAQLGAEGP